jgi:Putative sensor
VLEDSALTRFFGVVTRPRTWLGLVFHLLAFPLGLFYFVFLVTGISVGVGLVVVWVGIPILLVVAGAWWLFAAFERVQALHLLGARLPATPRPWERAEGIWGRLKAHFGSGSTWLDLAYLIAKLPFGVVSFTLVVSLAGAVGWLFAMPFMAAFDVPVVNGTWVPPLWFGILCVPLGLLLFVASLHVLNAWGWLCARWAEVLFGRAEPVAPVAPLAAQGPLAPPAPLEQRVGDLQAPVQTAMVPPAPVAPPPGVTGTADATAAPTPHDTAAATPTEPAVEAAETPEDAQAEAAAPEVTP